MTADAAVHLVVRITADGQVTAETHGATGTACLPYISLLEDLLEAETVLSGFTEDYHRVIAPVAATVSETLPPTEQRRG